MKNNYSYRVALHNHIRKDNTQLVYFFANINGVSVKISLGVALRCVHFDAKKQRAVGGKDKDLINVRIESYVSSAAAIIRDTLVFGRKLDADSFVSRLGKENDAIDFIYFFEKQILVESKIRASSTVWNYKKALRVLKKFAKRIDFNDLDINLVRKFDRFLRTLKIETGKKKGQFYETNTIADFHKQVNKFISLAIDEYNLDIKNPYSRFTIEKAETHRQFLTPSELAKFVKLYDVRHDVCLDSHLCDTLQMFLFMVGSGLRVSDSGRLQGLNVVEDTVQLRMQKTKRLKMGITFPLSAFALKYLPKHIENGKLFQYKTTQTFNRNLRYISTELLNIKKEVTSHIARHTFATSFILAGGRVEVLKNLLGHSDIRTTQIYIHLTQTVEREELKLLDAFLKFE